MPDWKAKESLERLLAAVVAAADLKLDYRKIASMYGQGATYDSIEGRFRLVKKDAAQLKAEIDNGERPEAPARGNAPACSISTTSRRPRGPKKNDGVAPGRVTKSASSTPTKQCRRNFTQETLESPASSSLEDVVPLDDSNEDFYNTSMSLDMHATNTVPLHFHGSDLW